MPSEGFKDRLNREIRLALDEMHDGCVDCLALGRGYCPRHHREALELITHPQRFIHLKTKPKEQQP